jgi:ketosteroid isomerase-like protein
MAPHPDPLAVSARTASDSRVPQLLPVRRRSRAAEHLPLPPAQAGARIQDVMSSNQDGTIQIVNDLFAWFNKTVAEGGTITKADVQRYFTDDAVMIANNRVKCRGIDAHLQHFDDLTAKMKSTEIQPFELVVEGEGRAAGYYRINFKAVDGTEGTIFDLAIWEFRAGKIARMTEIIHFEGAQVSLNDY